MFKIEETGITFDELYKSDFAPNDEKFKSANVIILPHIDFREGVKCCFTEYQPEILEYINSEDYIGIVADIATTDENVSIVEMHSLLLDIGEFLVTNVALPIFAGIISNYLYNKINSLHKNKEDVEVRLKITADNKNGDSRTMTYNGPADKLDEITNAVKELWIDK